MHAWETLDSLTHRLPLSASWQDWICNKYDHGLYGDGKPNTFTGCTTTNA